jgi:hypothetical protein
MPKRSTDRVKLEGRQEAVICRSLAEAPCESVGKAEYAPGAAADFNDHLPANLTSGEPQLLTYTVDLTNKRGHAAGPSNPVFTASGPAPAPIAYFAATVRADGILLRWQPASAPGNLVRLERVLEGPPKPSSSPMAGAPAPTQQILETDYDAGKDPGGTLDKDAALDHVYRYTAQRVAATGLDGHIIQIASTPSEAIVVNARDTFPPTVPSDLVAVANAEGHSIDLSWSPDTEEDLAGYIVYRREAGSSAAPVRISPAQPVTGPAFSDPTARPGVRYAYSVSAVDKDHNESARSGEVEEMLPNS